ncbi:MAG TPA: phosphotransferase [Acidimicrobiia bacterium]|nr:phosphotransferase [Acidimicrobiia bacterium]
MDLVLDDAARVLGSVFGTVPGRGPVIERRPWPLEGTFDAEVVTCRTAAGDVQRVYCKHGPPIDGTRHAAYGHRGGLAREAAVYSYVLEPLGVSAARCIGFRHDDLTESDWLVLEFLDGATPLLDSRRTRSLDRAAEWLGSFHGATEGLWPDLLLSGIPFRDAEWYQGWMDRTAGWAGALHVRYPWLAPACRRSDLYEPLLTAPHSVVHGEFSPANVLLRDGEVLPVDWESAAMAPGELDLAFFTLGWPNRLRRRMEAAYARRRWPAGPPASFEPTLRAARIHACFRVLGDSPMGPPAEDARTILKLLQSLL